MVQVDRINFMHIRSQTIVLGTQDIIIMTLQVKLTCKIASLGLQNNDFKGRINTKLTLKQSQIKTKLKLTQ